jgi:Trk K+ transport system NAD-binding subunit
MKTVSSYLASFLAGNNLRRQVMPFARYVLVLVAVVLLYGWLFHVIMAWEGQEHSWFTGVYWALTVMSTLGFGDITFHSDLGRAFSSVVLLTGILLLLIILPFLFIRLVYAPWLEQRRRARMRTVRSLPANTDGHVLICANDPIAAGLIQRLSLADVPAFVIEPDAHVALELHDEGLPVLNGEVDAVETYVAARVEGARLVLANASDAINSSIALTVRDVSESVAIAAIADLDASVDILELSGADEVLPLKQRLGEHLANRVSAGSARANVIGRFHDLLLAEFSVQDTHLQGRTIRETGLRKEIGVNIAAVWEQGRLLPAAPDQRLSPMSVPVVVGTEDQINELDARLGIYDAKPNPVVVIGGGSVGRSAARALRRRDIPVHIVERDEAVARKISRVPNRVFTGIAADREVLMEAGIKDAPSILVTTHDDATNVYLTVYCRRLNPEARLLTRVTHERAVESIHRAGADFVLSYASLGVQSVLALVQRRELIVLGEGVDLFHIGLPDGLAGQSLAEAEIGAKTGLNVIALQREGTIETNPRPSRELAPGTFLLALGSPDQRQRFRDVYG